MSSSNPPTSAPGESAPGALPTGPGAALWSDSDSPAPAAAPGAPAEDLLDRSSSNPLRTIGHIGRYALKYQLGEGGLGTVFAAHDPLLSRLIAVKTLNVDVPETERESFNTLFINEARAAGGLSHPHIVTVFDAGISDKRAYIAMEMLKGRDLRQLREEGWRATPAQAALIVRRVADALAFAHSKGVIHRDIKPANIFMVGRTQPRVLDFGIARVAHHHSDGDPHSGAGSPYYMAPEQVRREPADRRADVFSLGVVLYELLTGERPFQGKTLRQIREAVLGHEPPLASKVSPGVPKDLAEICARAMHKDAELRFRSARSFARELRQWLDANPSTTEGDGSAAPAAVRGSRLPRIAAWSAVALAIAGVSAFLGSQWLAASVPQLALPVAAPTAPTRALPSVSAVPGPAVAPPATAAPSGASALPIAAPAASALDPSASAVAARSAELSTPEALMSASLGLINAPAAPMAATSAAPRAAGARAVPAPLPTAR